MQVDIRPLTPGRVEDFFEFFEHIAFFEHPEWGCDCFCCFFHAQSREAWDKCTRETNKATARELILKGRMHGLLAYAENKPVGWCHYDILQNLPGARVFYSDLASTDGDSGAIVCFTIAQGYRNQGIATMLLENALADLNAQGVARVEAYPVMNDDSQEHNYLGPLSLYKNLGFQLVRQAEHHALVEKML
jgi:ribosomal protein S18 acetylase RimI-like enzyme